MQNIGPAERRALTLIATNRCTDRALVARGYSLDLLAGLVRAGFAEFTVERVGSGKAADIVCHLQVTAAGTRVLASNRSLPQRRDVTDVVELLRSAAALEFDPCAAVRHIGKVSKSGRR